MEEKLFKIMELENGLVLRLYDASKKVAGDRWQVSFLAKIEISIDYFLSDKTFSPNITMTQIKEVLGNIIIFEQKRERNFIDEKEKDEVFKALCVSFLSSSLSYLSDYDFPKKLIMKKYKENIGRQKWHDT